MIASIGDENYMKKYLPIFNGIDSDKLREECGVVGMYKWGEQHTAQSLFYGLYALQHRGQESAGIATNDGQRSYHYKKMGLVAEIFDDEILEQLEGHISIGHVRYGTFGGKAVENAQPLVVKTKMRSIALAHNGNLVNAEELKATLEKEGHTFESSIDSEVIIKLLAKYDHSNILISIEKTMDSIKGAYALVIMTENELIGIRDPHGLRPLCIGELEGGYVLASESCALDAIGATLIRDVNPGEIIIINKEGISCNYHSKKEKKASCVFEFVYFARPDTQLDGANVYETRKNAGKILAKEHPIDADMVVAVPDSSIPVALGYAEELGLSFGEGLFKNRYIGRTFIQPDQPSRERALRLKLSPLSQNIKGKSIVLVDDSIVRGTTSKRIVAELRKAGAKEVHLRISSPPVSYSCYFGIDTPNRNELLGSTKSIDEIRELIGADSLAYISLNGLLESTGLPKEEFCTACFNGNYPMEIKNID